VPSGEIRGGHAYKTHHEVIIAIGCSFDIMISDLNGQVQRIHLNRGYYGLHLPLNTWRAFNVCIQTGNHDLLNRNKMNTAPMKIGDNCWLGNSVTIRPVVEIGNNVTVGANSVVTKSFPTNVVIGGVPAQIIKEI
jgi:acetyltransferase-like isoleucine patch superfamily enzyme